MGRLSMSVEIFFFSNGEGGFEDLQGDLFQEGNFGVDVEDGIEGLKLEGGCGV